jgi:hypothetical protein
MALVKAYIHNVVQIQEIAPERFQIDLMVGITDTSHSQLQVAFEADWGADWKLLARQAISTAFLNAVGETVVGVIWPDFTATV